MKDKMGITKSNAGSRTKAVTVKIAPELDQAVEVVAAREGRSKSLMVSLALIRFPGVKDELVRAQTAKGRK